MRQLIQRLFLTLINTTALRVGTFPTSADGAAAAAVALTSGAVAWTFGAWVQIVAAAGVTADQQLIAVTLENFVGASSEGEVEIGTGAALAEVAIARVQATSHYHVLPRLLVPNATRIAARYRTSTGVADTVSVKLTAQSGF